MEVRRLRPADVDAVLAAASLFDEPPRRDWTESFLEREGHHLLIAYVDDQPAGFVSGVETIHPDKGAEMLLYELGVDDAYRRRGIGRALTESLLQVARDRGCYGMWVPIELDNEAAVATYRAAGAAEPEVGSTMAWDLTA
jgi:ribosomal protein S18 acetylase RimI-like enzyme